MERLVIFTCGVDDDDVGPAQSADEGAYNNAGHDERDGGGNKHSDDDASHRDDTH
tara:strand:- start:3379 stop:3543 length:165 start_codon:yes stop_codon:yes gene_type:complete